jgi:hypothetical protein
MKLEKEGKTYKDVAKYDSVVVLLSRRIDTVRTEIPQATSITQQRQYKAQVIFFTKSILRKYVIYLTAASKMTCLSFVFEVRSGGVADEGGIVTM